MWRSLDTYVFMLLIIFCGLTFLIGSQQIAAKEVGTASLAWIGTFMGALLAFRLTDLKETAKREEERKTALNRALFIVGRQRNAVVTIRAELSKFVSDFERAFNCNAFKPAPYDDLVHDFVSLGFLVEIDPNILMGLSIGQERFHQTLRTMEIRNEFYVTEVQPIIAAKGLNRQLVQYGEMREALGERIFETAINYAKMT